MDLKLNCLVTGYIKQEFLKQIDNYQYPEALTILFIRFLGHILFEFNAVCPKYKHYLDEAGQTLKIKGSIEAEPYLNVGSLYPFISGIYTLIIKLTSDWPGNNPMGIINNIDVFKSNHGEWIFNYALSHNYIYAIFSLSLCQSVAATGYGSNGMQRRVCKEWKENDEVKFIID